MTLTMTGFSVTIQLLLRKQYVADHPELDER
jgi:hypothetical protein